MSVLPIAKQSEDSFSQSCTYMLDYSKTSDGIADTCKIASRVTQALNFIPSFGGRLGPVGSLFEMMSSWFDIPNTFRDGLNCVNSAIELHETRVLPKNDPERAEIGEKVKKLFESGLMAGATASSAMLSLQEMQVLDLGSAATFASATAVFGLLYNTLMIPTETIGLVDALSDVQKYKSLLVEQTLPQDKEDVQSKLNLAYLQATKKAASIAWAVLGLIAVVFAALSLGLSVLPYIILGVSSIYVIMSMTLFFYERSIEDQRKARLEKGATLV